MKKNVLVDVKITCDPPSHVWRSWKTLEQSALEMEDWVKEFQEFIRDHRSQDPVRLNVERVYEDQCSFCGYKWETDEHGEPLCCSKAQEEWKQQQAEVKN